MMLRLFCVLSLLLVVSGPAAAIDGVSHSDACACSISHAHGMLPRTIDEDDPWVIYLGNRGRQLYAGIEVFEYDEFGQGSLASSLLGYLFRKDVRHKGDITYLRLGGRPAAYVEVASRYEGTAFRQRRYVVDAGDRLLIVSVFGSNRLWYDNAERVDDLLATLTVDPVANLSDPFGWSVDLLPGTLAEARAQHTVKTVAPRYQRILERAPDNVPYSRVSYDTELGEMVMYRSALPEDGLSPAVVWLPDLLTADPNGRIWEESGQDVMSAEAFREAGIVVTVPTFRGMARNPGEHEYFYGEVDDLLAAIDAVRAMPGVDPERVYLAGVGHGGTLALLATSSGAPVRGTLTYNANPWLFPTMAAGGFSRQPWDVTDAHATEQAVARSARSFISGQRAALFRISSTEASGVRGSSSRLFGAEAQPASTVVSVRARVDRRMERCMRGVLTSGIGAKGRRVGWRHCTQAYVQSPRCTAHPGQLLYNASQIAFRKSHDHCCRYSFCGGYADR